MRCTTDNGKLLDSDCGRLEKCCSNGCDMRCTTDNGQLLDSDCGRLEKCCSN